MTMQVDNATANWCGGVLLIIGLSGCGGYETAYERAVYAAEPVYCYRTIADPDCYRVADPASNRRVVNYYGPSPRRTKAPRPAEIRLDPPPPAEATAEADAGADAALGSGGRHPAAEAIGERAQPPTPLSRAAPADAPRLGGEGPGDQR
ncbi:MAG TPA: hypothetical protein VLR47_07850 [Rhodospirillales bacterium]|nr:hypothetical protein [Rhodospirillales bacterium]